MDLLGQENLIIVFARGVDQILNLLRVFFYYNQLGF